MRLMDIKNLLSQHSKTTFKQDFTYIFHLSESIRKIQFNVKYPLKAIIPKALMQKSQKQSDAIDMSVSEDGNDNSNNDNSNNDNSNQDNSNNDNSNDDNSNDNNSNEGNPNDDKNDNVQGALDLSTKILQEKHKCNLFVTSKNEITNSPIHQLTNLKCCIKARESFKTPFLMVYYFLSITLKNILSLAFSF